VNSDAPLSDVGTGRLRDAAGLLEELQRAAEEHQRILQRQSELITELREQLKDGEL
jgi:hypothetical protein